MAKLRIGQKVTWNDQESKHGERAWLHKGDTGTVTKYHPEIRGTGRVLHYDHEGDPVIDVGILPWYTLDFGPAGKRACDPADIGKTVLLQRG